MLLQLGVLVVAYSRTRREFLLQILVVRSGPRLGTLATGPSHEFPPADPSSSLAAAARAHSTVHPTHHPHRLCPSPPRRERRIRVDVRGDVQRRGPDEQRQHQVTHITFETIPRARSASSSTRRPLANARIPFALSAHFHAALSASDRFEVTRAQNSFASRRNYFAAEREK